MAPPSVSHSHFIMKKILLLIAKLAGDIHGINYKIQKAKGFWDSFYELVAPLVPGGDSLPAPGPAYNEDPAPVPVPVDAATEPIAEAKPVIAL